MQKRDVRIVSMMTPDVAQPSIRRNFSTARPTVARSGNFTGGDAHEIHGELGDVRFSRKLRDDDVRRATFFGAGDLRGFIGRCGLHGIHAYAAVERDGDFDEEGTEDGGGEFLVTLAGDRGERNEIQ
jgi:hypothetical protein